MGVVIESFVWEPTSSVFAFFLLSTFLSIFLFPYFAKSKTFGTFDHAVSSSFARFQRWFLAIYTLSSVMEGVWSVYGESELASYGVSKESMVSYLCVGYSTSLVLGPLLGVLSDLIGQKRICLLYCFLHFVVGVWKRITMSPSAWFANVCLSLAGLVHSFGFETWLVVEHEKQSQRNDSLNETFWLMTFLESASLIGGQVLANWLADGNVQSGVALSATASLFLSVVAIVCIVRTAKEPVKTLPLRDYSAAFYAYVLGDKRIWFLQATLRLVQLDRVAEDLSHHVMEHHEVMVKGMNLVRELEKDLKIANVICKNGRRNLTSSMNEASRDLIVHTHSKKKQALLDMLPILTDLRHARVMQSSLEDLVDEGNYCKAFQVLSEYLQLLDSLSEFSAIQEMTRGVEVWLGRTLHKLDSLLLGVCQEFKEDSYVMVLDAYALIGDVSGLAEKIQSFFMQEVISETHSVLKTVVGEDNTAATQFSRLTYSDLCLQTPESKFRQCLLRTLAVLFQLIYSYHEIMSFAPEKKVESYSSTSFASTPRIDSVSDTSCDPQDGGLSSSMSSAGVPNISAEETSERETSIPVKQASNNAIDDSRDFGETESSGESPWYYLRKESAALVSETLQRGRRNLWQLTTSRVSVLLSSPTASSTSMHQFLKNYEDLSVFILAGEAFCGFEVLDFREKLKGVCENYFTAFHRQSMHALKMVLEKETWTKLPPGTVQAINFAGLVGDGAPLIMSSRNATGSSRFAHSSKSNDSIDPSGNRSGFSYWLKSGNPFSAKLNYYREDQDYSSVNGAASGDSEGNDSIHEDVVNPKIRDAKRINGGSPVSGDENEDLHADYIDEDSQLPRRSFTRSVSRSASSHISTNDDLTAQTGSSLCLLRSMDKYARLMQKLEIVNVEFFKGICQSFGVFFYFVYQVFGQENTNSGGKGGADSSNHRLKSCLSRISQECEQWIKPQLSSSPSSSLSFPNTVPSLADVTPASPIKTSGHVSGTSFSLKERCAAVDTVSLVSRILHKSKAHLQSMLMSRNGSLVEDFFGQLVGSVPDLTEHLHRTTARILLHVNGYVDRIANSKWEVKELGVEHNGYVDLMLGEFKHYKTRLAHGGISQEVQNLLLQYGVEIFAEMLVEGFSRIKRCTDEGRALMSLDIQVLINGLQHFVPTKVKPKLQIVETFIKAYYLPETEYVHWARAHPEYTKAQVIGLVNLVATMKSWKRKTRLEVVDKIESAAA